MISLWAFSIASIICSRRLTATASNPLFHEQLSAQGLLGSHFGYVDMPKSYDYIVVGGGTAGLTIAQRLSQQFTVAVIEAGTFCWLENGDLSQIPADASYYLGKEPLFNNPRIDWRQMTTPQPGLESKPVLFPQGRTLGGGSTRNFMWYQRGSKGSYQKWADEVGDQSYSFSKFLHYFKMSVKFTPPNVSVRAANSTPQYSTSDYSSSGGPLHVSYPNFASPVASWLARGLSAIGLQELPGLVDGNLLGWTWAANTIDPVTQVRSTSETSFLREAMQVNDNLVVYSSTLAKKILFDASKKATGVLVANSNSDSGRTTFTLNATKEVIVSSGAFRSPQMLMVSGIGPAATLEKNHIEVLADLPGVGQNLWDHLWFGPSYAVNTVTHNWLGNPEYGAQASAEFKQDQAGILTNVGGDLLGRVT
jgi:choline dehydrogenase